MAFAVRLGDQDLIRKDFNAPANPSMKKQLAFILARAQVPKEWLENEDGMDDGEAPSILNWRFTLGSSNSAPSTPNLTEFG